MGHDIFITYSGNKNFSLKTDLDNETERMNVKKKRIVITAAASILL